MAGGGWRQGGREKKKRREEGWLAAVGHPRGREGVLAAGEAHRLPCCRLEFQSQPDLVRQRRTVGCDAALPVSVANQRLTTFPEVVSIPNTHPRPPPA